MRTTDNSESMEHEAAIMLQHKGHKESHGRRSPRAGHRQRRKVGTSFLQSLTATSRRDKFAGLKNKATRTTRKTESTAESALARSGAALLERAAVQLHRGPRKLARQTAESHASKGHPMGSLPQAVARVHGGQEKHGKRRATRTDSFASMEEHSGSFPPAKGHGMHAGRNYHRDSH